MEDIYAYSDKALLKMIGERLKNIRLERNITQKDLAKSAGIGLSSVSSLEGGGGTSLLTLIAALRALEALEIAEGLYGGENDGISPIEYMKVLDGRKRRKRAGRKKDAGKEDFEW